MNERSHLLELPIASIDFLLLFCFIFNLEKNLEMLDAHYSVYVCLNQHKIIYFRLESEIMQDWVGGDYLSGTDVQVSWYIETFNVFVFWTLCIWTELLIIILMCEIINISLFQVKWWTLTLISLRCGGLSLPDWKELRTEVI